MAQVGQQRRGRIGHDHADDQVVAHEPNAFHAAGVPAHGAGVGLLEADGHAVGGGQQQFVARLGHDHVDQRVALAELDGDNAAPQRPAVGRQRRLLHQPAGGGHHEEMVGEVEIPDGAAIGDVLVLAEVQQVDDRAAAGVAGQLRQIVDFPPVDLALVREEQQVGVGAGHEQVLDRVLLLGLRPG